MPFNQVMSKFGSGSLHSGSPTGPKVANRKQAIAIMLDEKAKAAQGNPEYAAAPAAPAGPPASLRGLGKAVKKGSKPFPPV